MVPVGIREEQIAALRPDLIIGISAGLTPEQYETYSRIAPTVAAPAGFVEDLRARFFSAFGMRGVPACDRNAGDRFYGSLSTEQLGQLDQADAVVPITSSAAERTAFQSQPGYPALRVVRENRVVALDDTEAAALSFSSVLSLPSALDSLPGKLAAAAR